MVIIQLPKYKKKEVVKLKQCSNPKCGKEYWGHPISKYCEACREAKIGILLSRDRKKERKKIQVHESNNREFKHMYAYPTDVLFTCALDGCQNEFLVKVLPKLFVYPNYCQDHRSAFRRVEFTRRLKNAKNS